MEIIVHENGQYVVNSFLVINEVTKECFIIDPGDEIDPIYLRIEKEGLKPVAIVCTHGHIDHMEGVRTAKSKYGCPFYLNELDWHEVQNVSAEEALEWGVPEQGVPNPDENLPLDETIELAGIKIKVLHTPGHTKGSVSLLIDNVVFTGDSLMSLCIGRTDIPGSDHEELLDSIREKLFTLPDKTHVFPGHGPFTNIEQEKRINPYLKM